MITTDNSTAVPDASSTQLARNVASGKECIQALLVLGSILQFFRDTPVDNGDDIYLVAVPSTEGPCRTGQYHVFFDRLFEEMTARQIFPEALDDYGESAQPPR